MFKEILFGLETLAYGFLKVVACIILVMIFFKAGPIVGLLVGVFAACVYLRVKKEATKERFFERHADAPTATFTTTPRVYSEPSEDGSEYKAVIEASKRLERQLTELNAVGKGLHEKISSIEASLPNELVSLLRRIGTIRNKLVHEDDFALSPRQLRDFKNQAEDAYEDLDLIINGDSRMSVGQLSTRTNRNLLGEDKTTQTESNANCESAPPAAALKHISDLDSHESATKAGYQKALREVHCSSCGQTGEPREVKEGGKVRFTCCGSCAEIIKVHGSI